jgi:phage major head subunit gpT-like protein
MNCPRCNGMMMVDKYLDLHDDTGEISFNAWRCLVCGEVVDPVILKNREKRPAPMNPRNRKLMAQSR